MKHSYPREAQELQRKLRSQFESLYKQKCQNYFNMLETKYQTLKEAIETVFKHIQNDEVLSTMFNDRTTSVHMNQRVKEIFSEVITHQREIIFKKLGTQITNLKFQNQQLQREIEKLKSSNENLEKNFTTERQSLEKRSNHTTEELRKLREELGHYKNKSEELTAENKDLKYLIQNIKENHEANERENEVINDYRMKVRQMESTIDDLKNQLKENQQKFQKKYQAKRKEYKQKIESYKTVITQINNQRLETQEVVRRAEQENANIHLEKKMLALMREHEKKVAELRSTKDREKVKSQLIQSQLEKMYEFKMKETQSHFQKLLEQKLTEMQDNAGRYFQRMKEQGANLERHLEHYQQHYVPIAEYQEQISKRDEIMILMKNKLDQFQEMSEEYLKKEEMLTTKIKDSEIVIGNWKQKTYNLEETNQQLIGKLKSYEQTNNIFKISQQKSKDQFGEYERLVKKTKEEYEDLKHNYLKLEQEKSHNQSLIREKDRKIKDSSQENQILLKKIKKLNESIEQQIKQRQALSVALNQHKKQITNLQYKLKDKEMTSTLNITSWQSKSNNFQLQLKEKNKLLTDLQQKYQQMSTNYQEQKRKNYEVETLMKKYEMESRFYKEATEMQKNEGISTAEEYKRVVNEKNEKVSQMQSEIERKAAAIANLQNELRNQKEKSMNDSKRATMKIKKLSKALAYQLESLRKENISIINYLKAREAIMKNDQSIFRSTFSKELIHLTMNHQHQIDKNTKNVKAEMNEVLNNQARTLKVEFQEKVKEINEKMEAERAALKRQIKEKDNKLEEMNKQQKKLIGDLKKQAQQTSKSQRQYQSLLRKTQKQKESYQSKLKDLLRQMKDQNDQILKQYQDKKYLMEQQIQNLVSSLKRLKLETQAIQTKHQQEKASINGQLRTIRQQQEVIQKVVQQKDLQIARTLKDYEASLESKRILENQNRGYVDNLNRKVQHIHQLEIKDHQITGQLNLLKNKCERITEQNSELKRKLSQKQEQLQDILRNKTRFQSQLKDIKGALSRSSKNNELRALNELSMQTLQLSQKVNEMRKVSTYLQSKTPLRS